MVIICLEFFWSEVFSRVFLTSCMTLLCHNFCSQPRRGGHPDFCTTDQPLIRVQLLSAIRTPKPLQHYCSTPLQTDTFQQCQQNRGVRYVRQASSEKIISISRRADRTQSLKKNRTHSPRLYPSKKTDHLPPTNPAQNTQNKNRLFIVFIIEFAFLNQKKPPSTTSPPSSPIPDVATVRKSPSPPLEKKKKSPPENID